MPSTENILSILADNPALTDAVKAVLVKQFSTEPVCTPDVTDMVLGQFLRAKMSGMKAIDEAFKEIARYRTTPDKPERQNPAR